MIMNTVILQKIDMIFTNSFDHEIDMIMKPAGQITVKNRNDYHTIMKAKIVVIMKKKFFFFKTVMTLKTARKQL